MAKKVGNSITEEALKRCLIAIMDSLGDEDYNYYVDFDITGSWSLNKIKVKANMNVTVPAGGRQIAADRLKKKLNESNYSVDFQKQYKWVNVYIGDFEEDKSRIKINLKEEKVEKTFVKPDKTTGGGGSGGGSTQTAIVESAQCLYCDLAFNVYGHAIDEDELIDKADLEKAYRNIEVDSSLDNMLAISSAWKKSSIRGANSLFEKFNGKGTYKFYRNKGIDVTINQAYKLIKNDKVVAESESIKDKVPQMEDKWNPADIWMAKSNFVANDIIKAASSNLVLNLNNFLIQRFLDNELIGVSLKKITADKGDLEEMNLVEDRALKLGGVGFGGATFNYDTVDTYIDFKSSSTKEIQFRNFDSRGAGWQGEVGQKGSGAKHGKIGGGAIWAILDAHNVSYHSFANKSSQVYKDCHADNEATKIISEEIYNKLSAKVPAADRPMTSNKTQEIYDIVSMGPRWMYTKFLGVTLIDAVKSATNADEIVQDIYLYASSQHPLSGVYYKLT